MVEGVAVVAAGEGGGNMGVTSDIPLEADDLLTEAVSLAAT